MFLFRYISSIEHSNLIFTLNGLLGDLFNVNVKNYYVLTIYDDEEGMN